jgi:thioester reductase-like protein
MHLLLTGATGSVGIEVLRALRGQPAFPRLTVLLRPSARADAAERWTLLQRAHELGFLGGTQVDVAPGDIESPGLGLSGDDRHTLASSVTHILHCAARIRFDSDYGSAHRANVGGTQHVVDLARGWPRLRHFGHVSTLFVVGTRAGVLGEAAEPDGSFNNTYEQTKHEAEALVRASGLPYDIYRLSLLQGRAQDGHVHTFLESHMLMEAFCRGMCPVLPGGEEATLDMMPTDFSAAALCHLLQHSPAAGRTWHVAAGDQAVSMKLLYELVAERLAAQKKSAPPPPRPMDRDEFDRLLAAEDPSSWGVSDGARMILKSVAGYLLAPKRFIASSLPGLAPAPAVREWLPRVLDYCIANRWGRGRATA